MMPCWAKNIEGTKARITLKTPITLTLMIYVNSSTGIFYSGAGVFIKAALLINKSGDLFPSNKFSAQAETALGSDISITIN